jgi:hypothetical protein
VGLFTGFGLFFFLFAVRWFGGGILFTGFVLSVSLSFGCLKERDQRKGPAAAMAPQARPGQRTTILYSLLGIFTL